MPERAAHLLVPGLRVESALERAIACDPVVREGWAHVVRHPGHPERTVGRHVADLLRRIRLREPQRAQLRLVALLHDTLKFRVRPVDGRRDHAELAARFARSYVDDPAVLATIELHDQPRWLWGHAGPGREEALAALVRCLPDPVLFARFVALDQTSRGKDPQPLVWFEQELTRLGVTPSVPTKEPT